MSPERARVFLVEDSGSDLVNARFLIEHGGHEVIVEARSLSEALSLVPRLQEMEINVAVLDGNLSEGKSDGEEGKTVAEEIRALDAGIKIVCFSGNEYDWGDAFVGKGRAFITDSVVDNSLPRTIRDL